jgi:hypothetical protein
MVLELQDFVMLQISYCRRADILIAFIQVVQIFVPSGVACEDAAFYVHSVCMFWYYPHNGKQSSNPLACLIVMGFFVCDLRTEFVCVVQKIFRIQSC